MSGWWWWRHPEPAVLIAYVDGQGSMRARARLTSHFLRCEACAAALQRVQHALSDEAGPLRMPDQLAARVRAGLVHAPAVTRPAWTAASRLACAAGLLLAVAAGSRAGHAELRDTSGRPLRALEAAALDAHRVANGTRTASLRRAEVVERVRRESDVGVRLVDHLDGATRTRWLGTDVVRAGRTTASVIHAELDGEVVTLVTARAAAVEGPEPWTWAAKPMDIRRGQDGLRTFTWANGGQAYALVSNERLGMRGCLLCHRDVP